MNTEPSKWLSTRQRRAVALAAMAVIAIAAASFVYLHPAPKSQPEVPGSSINPLQVSNLPVAYAFVTPLLGWAASVSVGQAGDPGQFMVFRTVDGAQHWQQQIGGQSFPGFTRGFAPISVQLFGKTRGFMTIGKPVQQLYRTADGGVHWIPVPLLSLTIDAITFSDASSGWLSGSFTATSGPVLRLFATHDAGDSWTRLPDPPADATGLGFRRPNEAWLGSFGPVPPHVYISSDSGQSWQRHDLPAPAGRSWVADPNFPSIPTTIQLLPGAGAIASGEAIRCVVPSPEPGGCLDATAETFLFTSGDVGNTWKPMPPPPGVVAFQDSAHWWATTENTLFKSTNAGQSWKQVATIPAYLQFSAPSVLDSKHGWAVVFVMGGYGLAMTNDGGLHWTLANVPKAAHSP